MQNGVRTSGLIVAALGLLAAASAPAHAVTYDLANDFSATNPSPVWAYGYYAPDGRTFPTYTAATNSDPVESWTDPSLPQTATYGTPSDSHNTSNSVYTSGSAVFLPGQATFHPGQNDEMASYRFTAPTTGNYQLDALFSGRDYVGPTDTQVTVQLGTGAVIFIGIVDGYAGDPTRAQSGPSPTVAFNDLLSLTAGDDIFFNVAFDPAGTRTTGPFYYDTTGIAVDLTTVPEPPAAALLAIGVLGTLAVARWRKSV